MPKKTKHLRKMRLNDAYIFVRHACDIITSYRDDPSYMPSKSDLNQFDSLKRNINLAYQLASEVHLRMEGRFEGHNQPSSPESNP